VPPLGGGVVGVVDGVVDPDGGGVVAPPAGPPPDDPIEPDVSEPMEPLELDDDAA
jgi:hypothetical protein